MYNIRRERRCEFIGEGRRKSDLIRWRAFDALFPENMGKYIPEGVNFWTQMYKDEAYLKVDEKGNVTDESALIEQAEGKGGCQYLKQKGQQIHPPIPCNQRKQ